MSDKELVYAIETRLDNLESGVKAIMDRAEEAEEKLENPSMDE